MIQSVKSNSTFSPSFSTFNFSINYACTYQSLLFIRSEKIHFETDVFVNIFIICYTSGFWVVGAFKSLKIKPHYRTSSDTVGTGLAQSNSWSSYLYLIPIFIVCYAKPCRMVPSHKMLSTPT